MKREKFSKLQLPPSPRPTYLVDTNIFLEILLSQENAFRAERWIQSKRVHELGISDFSLNTIGLKLYRKQLPFEAFRHKVDLGGLSVFALGLTEWTSVFRNCQKWTLDYDDAYQYTLARKYGLDLVSFDRDFDKTDMKRIVP